MSLQQDLILGLLLGDLDSDGLETASGRAALNDGRLVLGSTILGSGRLSPLLVFKGFKVLRLVHP